MKRLLHPHDRSSESQQENNAAGSAPDTTGDTVERAPHPKTQRIPLRSFSLFWITLFITTLLLASGLVPQSPSLLQVTGNGGMTVGKPMCGTPLQVVHHFGITNPIGVPYTALTIPTSVQLAALPRPAAGNPVSYNPQTSILCALNSVALQSAWLTINPIVATLPTATPAPSTTSGATPPPFQSGSTNLWSQGALDALGGVWNGLYHWAGQTITYVEDWATATLGFLWVTPAALTYKNHVVQVGVAWMLGLMDGLLMLMLVLGGYQCLIRSVLGEPRQEVLAFLFRLLIAAVVANFGTLYVIPQLIDLNNTLCAGSLQVFLHASPGDFSVPFFGGANWLQQPLSWSLFLLVDFVLALLLILSMLVRLALFLVCYILAPIGILFLGSDAFRAWGRLWCRLFFFSLFIQFLQVLVVAIGSAFSVSMISLGSEGSLSPTTLFVGIATLYLAFKLPSLLMQPFLGAIYGDAQQGASLAGSLMALVAA
jgi:hypothetical protein